MTEARSILIRCRGRTRVLRLRAVGRVLMLLATVRVGDSGARSV
jgi:hypothetical protein